MKAATWRGHKDEAKGRRAVPTAVRCFFVSNGRETKALAKTSQTFYYFAQGHEPFSEEDTMLFDKSESVGRGGSPHYKPLYELVISKLRAWMAVLSRYIPCEEEYAGIRRRYYPISTDSRFIFTFEAKLCSSGMAMHLKRHSVVEYLKGVGFRILMQRADLISASHDEFMGGYEMKIMISREFPIASVCVRVPRFKESCTLQWWYIMHEIRRRLTRPLDERFA